MATAADSPSSESPNIIRMLVPVTALETPNAWLAPTSRPRRIATVPSHRPTVSPVYFWVSTPSRSVMRMVLPRTSPSTIETALTATR